MEIHDLKKKTEEELKQMRSDLKNELRDLRFQAANMQLKNVRKIRTVRKDISRISTLLNQPKKS
ncbi:MAG: 50S ribosomal protein L29 [Candidatus Kerfeldbacteria bacterium]